VRGATSIRGAIGAARETYYESSRFMWLDHLIRDLRHSVRELRRCPVSTAVIILSLALGIGASTSIFSIADQALLRPLPVAAPEQIVQLHWNGRFVGGGLGFGSLLPHPFYRELRDEQDVFVDMLARSQAEALLSAGDEPEPVSVEVVTGSYFPMIGVHPAVGRLFTDADDRQVDAHALVVLSYDYWQRRFGADPGVVGRRVRLNDYPMTVIGVAEQGFRGMDWSRVPAIWVPMMMNGRVVTRSRLTERRERFLHVYARLRQDISRERAEVQLQPWFKSYLRADTEREGWPGVSEQQLKEYLASRLELLPGGRGQAAMDAETRQPMLILLGATGLGLLLACLNVANVTLARTLANRPAIALRTALGASRRRIVARQLVESALLALAGCIAGALFAPLISQAILSFFPVQHAAGIGLHAGLDGRVVAFAFALTLLATLLSGAAPAFYAASVHPVAALKRHSAAVAGGLASRKLLVVAQFALALILLIGAGLFARTLLTLRAQGPGFPTTNMLMFRVAPMRVGYDLPQAKTQLRALLAELNALPDVEQAGLAVSEMLRSGSWNNPVTIESTRRFVTEEAIPMNAVTPGFFATLGAPIVVGRDFDARDTLEKAGGARLRAAVVNEEFVARYLPGTNPIGVRVGLGDRPDVVTRYEIVGVVQTFQTRELREPEGQIFFSLWERPVEEGTFYVRARSSSVVTAPSIRAAVNGIDPKLAVLSLRTIDDQLDRMLVYERMLATTAIAFAAVATLLAMIGLYGLLSFSAALREKEIGVRLALGAQRWEAGGLIVREAAVLAAAGALIALPASWGLGRLVESWLFGVRPMDTATIGGAAIILALVSLAASALPARRAGSVSLVDVLRSE